MIQFILNHTLVQFKEFRADTTLLDYLRLDANLKGSKEGCASGDCGACSVVIANLSKNQQGEDKLEYKTINSCIYLLGSLHGKQVITVDGLSNKLNASKDKHLHPVQQAMVEQHASQCGFCTPGFVMSIFAMSKQNRKYNREEIVKSLDGNLCRCTGYRPIIDAAQIVLNNDSMRKDSVDFEQQQLKVIEKLKAIKSDAKNKLYIDKHFLIPQSITELSSLLEKNPNFKLLAGGTDLVLDITQRLKKQDEIIYLGYVKELSEIAVNDNEIMIGAAATYQESIEVLSKEYPELEKFLDRIGSLQIRNVATIGGNIANASPIGDMPPVLLALNAQLSLQKGTTIRQVSMDDFYTAYKQTVLQAGEFIRCIHIPRFQSNHYFNVYKISKRHADDISAVCAAFYLDVVKGKVLSARIALGGMAATVLRAKNTENIILNQLLNNKTLEKAKEAIIEDFDPLDDVRASRDYRLKVAQNILQKLFVDIEARSK